MAIERFIGPAGSGGEPVVPRLSAQALFTDRDDERARLREFFVALRDRRRERPVLHFYGVGGVGKTALIKQAELELSAEDRSTLCLVRMDLDNDRWTPRAPIGEFFWLLRSGLAKAAGGRVSTPLFDYLYLELWKRQNPGQIPNLQSGAFREMLERAGDGGAVAAEFGDAFKGGGAVGGAIKLVEKFVVGLRDRARKAGLDRLGIRPEESDEKAAEWELARALHADLLAWLENHPESSLCMAVDGFERVQSTAPAHDIQRCFQRLCGFSLQAPTALLNRLGYVILGRESLRWDDLYDAEWKRMVEERRMEGLTERDARRFLETAAAHHAAGSDSIVAEALRTHADAVLAATREQPVPGNAGSYHPYHLDLAYGIIWQRRADFRPGDLGRDPAELEIRFLRYLQAGQPEAFCAFQCLSLAGTFDEALFEALERAGCITAGLNFHALVGDDYSFVDEVRDAPGVHRFHRLMERALRASQVAKPEDHPAVRKRLDAVLEHYIVCATAFSALAECTPVHLVAYRQGMEIAFACQEDGLLSWPCLRGVFVRLEAPFDDLAFIAGRLSWHKRLAKLCEKTEGVEHPDTLSCVNNLASLLRNTGDLASAKLLYQRVLEARERTLGADHPATLRSMGSLSSLLNDLGELANAEPLARHALEACERTLGVEHRSTLSSANSLAGILYNKGDLTAAKILFRNILRLRERTLGDEHPETLTSVNNLALLLYEVGETDEAELLFMRAFKADVRMLGLEHPSTLISMNNLAGLRYARGDLFGAGPLLRRVFEVRKRILGIDHPDTLGSANNLASFLQAEGELGKAEPLYRCALEGWERTFGAEHPATLTSVNNLAGLLESRGNLIDAELLFRRALETRERTLGVDHPNTLTSVNNLANLLLSKGNLFTAEILFRRAIEARGRILGAEHPDTLTSMNNLGSLLQAKGDVTNAELLYRKTLESRERTLGAEHLDTLISTSNLANLLQITGRLTEAEPLLRLVFETRGRLQGAKHPDTLMGANNMAGLLQAKGDLTGAELLFRRASEGLESILGADHPNTKLTKANWTECLAKLAGRTEL